MNSFMYPEKEIRKRKRFLGVIVLALGVSGLPPLIALDAPWEYVLGFGITWGVLSMLLAVFASFLFYGQRQHTLIITEQGIVLKRQNSCLREIHWGMIRQVRVSHNPSGEMRGIEIRSTSQRPFQIIGFENMQQILHHIQTYIFPPISPENSTWKWNYESPTMLFVFVLTVSIFIGGLIRLDIPGLLPFGRLLLRLGFGIFFLWYSPCARVSTKRRIWDLVLGGLMVGGMVFELFYVLFK